MAQGKQKRLDNHYSKTAIVLHWLIALCVIGLILFGHLMTNPQTPNRFVLYQLHKSFGILVLLLSLLRLGWRLRHKPPSLPAGMKPWEIQAARFTHIAFYVFMIGMPLLGWALVSASPTNIPTVLFKIMPWPHLPILPDLDNKEAVSKILTQLHHLGGKLMAGLIILHMGAALKHHLVNRDVVLMRMLPFLKQRR